MATEQAAPIIVERKKSEPRERRTRLDFVQNTESNILHTYQHVVDSANKGLNAYITARNESIKAKGDEAYADMLPNVAKGWQAAIESLSVLPTDIVKIFYPEQVHDFVADGIHTVVNVIPSQEKAE